MKAGDDGSLTIYIQNESPGKGKERNWLPSPKEGFKLALRPTFPEAGHRRNWKPPAVKKVS
jgi:hypothetical protein